MARDLSALLDHTNTVLSIEPVDDRATDLNGAAATLATFAAGNNVCIIAVVGTSVFTPTASNYVCLEVEESTDDGSTYTDVANANLSRTQLMSAGGATTNTGTFAAIDSTSRDAKIYSTTYIRTSKAVDKIRVVANFTGTVTGGIPLAVIITQAHPADAPTAA